MSKACWHYLIIVDSSEPGYTTYTCHDCAESIRLSCEEVARLPVAHTHHDPVWELLNVQANRKEDRR
jgi:hypothetical protein